MQGRHHTLTTLLKSSSSAGENLEDILAATSGLRLTNPHQTAGLSSILAWASSRFKGRSWRLMVDRKVGKSTDGSPTQSFNKLYQDFISDLTVYLLSQALAALLYSSFVSWMVRTPSDIMLCRNNWCTVEPNAILIPTLIETTLLRSRNGNPPFARVR